MSNSTADSAREVGIRLALGLLLTHEEYADVKAEFEPLMREYRTSANNHHQ
jgi:hypothetical protein